MNAVTPATQPGTPVATLDDNALINVLQNSLYPGARPESIALVLAWCRATGRDPMLKPIHIVPMNVKIAGTNRYEWRDTLMPGIGTYRTDAATTGQYAGKSEPEFGPDVTSEFMAEGNRVVKLTHPHWCKVTVQRLVGGQVRDFTAKEFWMENYATAGRDTEAPNAMWKKRPYAQLAKCAESQALRMAFPGETGNTNTAEEMEGKSFAGPTIEHEPTRQPIASTVSQPDADPSHPERDPKLVRWVDDTCKAFAATKTLKARNDLIDKIEAELEYQRTEAPELAQRLTDAIAASGERLQAVPGTTKPAEEKTAEPEPFEHFLIDEFGEPTTNAAGEMVMLPTGLQFANAFSGEAAKTGNIDALRENNSDAIGDAGRDQSAAQIIQAAINGAQQRIAKKNTKEPAAETAIDTGLDTTSEPLPMPLTPGKKPHFPNYLAHAKTAIAALAFEADVTAWRELNRPRYTGSPIEAGVERALRERVTALDPSPETPKRDQDREWAEESVAWINDPKQTYDIILKWAMGAIPQAKMPRLKADRGDLYEMVRDAIDARKPAA